MFGGKKQTLCAVGQRQIKTLCYWAASVASTTFIYTHKDYEKLPNDHTSACNIFKITQVTQLHSCSQTSKQF